VEDVLSKSVKRQDVCDMEEVNTWRRWGRRPSNPAKSTPVPSSRSARKSGGCDCSECDLRHIRCSASHREYECCEEEGEQVARPWTAWWQGERGRRGQCGPRCCCEREARVRITKTSKCCCRTLKPWL
jgi:hypothetical protein